MVATVNGAPVRIRDVGYAEDGTKEQRSVARLNGVPTVTLEVRRQSGANTVEVIEAVKAEPGARQAAAPGRRQAARSSATSRATSTPRCTRSTSTWSWAASWPRLVVLAFMRSWRSTVIAAVAIPASVIATFGMMKALDFTLNSVTMLALVLMVGIVIDDAIVVLENIFRFVEEKKMHAVRGGARGDGGDRPGGAGDDALAGRHLRPGVVHVEHLGALPLPVRHHGGGGGAGLACWSPSR